MRLLLDTQIVLWQLSGARTLASDAVDAIREADELHVSVISFAEIGIKAAVGKLIVPDGLRESIRTAGVQTLGLAPEHGLGVSALPLHHRDPFDRLLISQASCERLTIVTADSRFAEYAVPIVPVGFAA